MTTSSPPTEASARGYLDEDGTDPLMICSTCLDTLLDPVTVIPCGHSFCAICVDRWIELGRRTCPLCGVPMMHIALSYVLKSLVERQHTLALVKRRETLGVDELHYYSRDLLPESRALQHILRIADSALRRLPARMRPLDILAPRFLFVSFFVLFTIFFCYLQLIGFSHLLQDGDNSGDLPLEILTATLDRLPALVAKVFCASFVIFFAMLTGWQHLMFRHGVGLLV
uniref:RING-type domain-containing protein n=1 Tax=Coccolithus braarudii TaxID=221442 RepID=A0A7S0PZ18_9EUKA|mmetsp:Transcript_24245/g.52298  ORF Transcript_24245/g.52298 Transcript_24245/m.52298 type:complete len:227 (+) Transcript_24245:88-768(+)|eukprot:CAMPEP_0183351680 /NCGR_PEP_ID=MMETSP0164_2-20130417/26185_1 /TAXON_ID=221442 /ORGANISM="Coccolithus pelagicus ssp braarudi, Strain PLY182g" /LENGTH=226 /DNA_ID=CAMNT_0025523923 /DNA_START=83 /DNA_END=763 /DNA_ORIENTATION=-